MYLRQEPELGTNNGKTERQPTPQITATTRQLTPLHPGTKKNHRQRHPTANNQHSTTKIKQLPPIHVRNITNIQQPIRAYESGKFAFLTEIGEIVEIMEKNREKHLTLFGFMKNK
jgi:hypothetical protein